MGSRTMGNTEVYKLNVTEACSYIAGVLAEQAAEEAWLQQALRVLSQRSEGSLAFVEIVNETAEELTGDLEGFGTITRAPKERVTRAVGEKAYEYKAYIPSLLPVSGQYTFENGFHYTWVFSTR